MALVRCLKCGKKFDPRRGRALPFCSETCRLTDLQGWLREEHGLPVVDEEEGEAEDETMEDGG
jgi:endogenous inhibitor of DNA gyrase (YacG/DUF329 family)